MCLLAIITIMIDSARLVEIRSALGLSQEAMAHLLGISFATVNRWENRHSSPTGAVLEIYRALDAAPTGWAVEDGHRWHGAA